MKPNINYPLSKKKVVPTTEFCLMSSSDDEGLHTQTGHMEVLTLTNDECSMAKTITGNDYSRSKEKKIR